QEALTRDEFARTGGKERKGAIRQKVKPFIQNVHLFRDEGLRRSDEAPFDHVVIFDEAQRAWNREKTSDFMKRRKKIRDFHQSEPEFLISYLDRHVEWAVIICLVGGGENSRIVLQRDPRLHLASSMRSFRSENVSKFVKAVL